MNRVFVLVTISFLWLLPASSAFAGTWSWHSDFVEKIMAVIEAQQTRAKDHAQDADTNNQRARQPKAQVNRRAHPTR